MTDEARRLEMRELVTEFLNRVFNDHDLSDAALAGMGDTYIQHNPTELDGRDYFVKHFGAFLKDHPHSGTEILQIVAEGDLVAVLQRWRMDAETPGVAVVDMYRIEGNRMVEHWDVIQPVDPQAVPDWTATSTGPVY